MYRIDEGELEESRGAAEFRDAIVVAAEGNDRVQEMFPDWKVDNEAHANAATWGTMEKIRDWNPDLVVVGSHGRSALGRLFKGSVGQTLLAEAHCSVEVVRVPH